MKGTNQKALYAEANQLLTRAAEEMNRAEEDSVTYVICHNSRQSIANFLKGFLLEKGVTPNPSAGLAALLEQCQNLDPRFQEIDLSGVHCRFDSEPAHHCLNHEEVDGCFHVAQQTQQLIAQGI